MNQKLNHNNNTSKGMFQHRHLSLNVWALFALLRHHNELECLIHHHSQYPDG
jgi:hypothetical protein